MGNYLYIPTTTRNLNNILISRSISPACFYPQKGFGVPRFHLVDLNDNQHVTYCYSDKLEFSIINTDYEEDPILIIIPLSYIKECTSDSKKIEGTTVHRVRDTIELKDLLECGVGFFSEDARKRCEVNAEKALEIKGFHYIKDILKLTSSDQKSISVNDCSYKINDSTKLINEDKLLRIERLNEKIKGANFCYILSLASKYKYVCWFSPELPKKYWYIKQLLNSREVLKNTEVGGVVASKTFKSAAKLLETDNKLLDVIIRKISEIDVVFNHEHFKEQRIELLLDIGKEISTIISDWADSPERQYLNSFGRNLTEFTEFDINQTDSIVLKSFVFVLLCGRDLDKIDRELENHSIEEHGVSFLIWGMFFGYCNIPKTIYDPIFGERKPTKNPQKTNAPVQKNLSSPEKTMVDGAAPICEDCNSPMIKKVNHTTKGPFWTCKNWNKNVTCCRKTITIKPEISPVNATIDSNDLQPIIFDIKVTRRIGVSELKNKHKSILGKMTILEICNLLEWDNDRIKSEKLKNKNFLVYSN
jgi:hypothetical protein